ncbi:hypothetical protein LCGC14_2530970 [marine sediment metagenome]|uniref:Uncharacterized protein n=1 Tax=marine sediment metagenome TaxID=412755 RepID=A0A0F9BGE7_9ZZZZ
MSYSTMSTAIPFVVAGMPSTKSASIFASACATVPFPNLVNVGVGIIVLMLLGAMSFADIGRDEGIPPETILAYRHDFHVPRIDTTGVPAQVVDDEPIGNRADAKRIRDAVGILAHVLMPVKILELPVPCGELFGEPRPTGITSASRVHLCPETRPPCGYLVHAGIIVTREEKVNVSR